MYMKIKYLVVASSVMIGTLSVHGIGLAQQNASNDNSTITSQTKDNTSAVSDETVREPRLAAQQFVEHINYARVALAMKDNTLAMKHINHARSLYAVIKTLSANGRKIAGVGSGKISTKDKYLYFPFEVNTVEIKELKKGPLWRGKGLAVIDAEIAYLTLDLNKDIGHYLADAEKNIQENKTDDADANLAHLTEEVVALDDAISLPLQKARDNIALARNFFAAQNYDGARFALKHADTALDAMEDDDRYKSNLTKITAIRKEVLDLEKKIEKNDPTLLGKAEDKMEGWWKDLKNWDTQSNQSKL